jgi:hypothetical protein
MPLSECQSKATASSVQRSHCSACAAWMPSAEEVLFYDALFTAAELSGTGELQGAPAVAFFQRSGLERGILKQVGVA